MIIKRAKKRVICPINAWIYDFRLLGELCFAFIRCLLFNNPLKLSFNYLYWRHPYQHLQLASHDHVIKHLYLSTSYLDLNP